MTVYELITSRIVAKLQEGVIPWRKPWAATGSAPRNLVSGKPYRGINAFLLAMEGCPSPWFVTFKQALALGGSVRKGSKGFPVIFWKFPKEELELEDDGKSRAAILRYFTVFHISQCDGLVSPTLDAPNPVFDPIAACEAVVINMPHPPVIQHGGDRACYQPSRDLVCVPPAQSFTSREEYYSTLFHELGHASGHESRLARKGITDGALRFGSHGYSREELVAEMVAAFLSGHTGIAAATVDNSAAYLASWLNALKADHRMLVLAAAQAQKAADFILGAALDPPPEELAA
jgi:antirestriction protein ArdC